MCIILYSEITVVDMLSNAKYLVFESCCHAKVISGTVFTALKTQPMVKALKKDRVLSIRLQSHLVNPTVLQ